MDDKKIEIIKMYEGTLTEFNELIHQTELKAQKAMRITLWLKVIVAFASVYSIGAWLQKHGEGEVWAVILIFGEIADMLFDTLPYFQQRVTMPQMKLKMEHIFLEFESDRLQFDRGDISEDEALRRYFSHRKAWLKVVG